MSWVGGKYLQAVPWGDYPVCNSHISPKTVINYYNQASCTAVPNPLPSGSVAYVLLVMIGKTWLVDQWSPSPLTPCPYLSFSPTPGQERSLITGFISAAAFLQRKFIQTSEIALVSKNGLPLESNLRPSKPHRSKGEKLHKYFFSSNPFPPEFLSQQKTRSTTHPFYLDWKKYAKT